MTTQADIDRASRRSVQVEPDVHVGSTGSFADDLVIGLATAADDFIPWGRDAARRDLQLRQFWPTEPVLASAVYALAIRNSVFSWTLEGPPKTVEAVQDMLAMADLGAGWLSWSSKLSVDVMTQDNGGFIEPIRERDEVDAPVIGIAHLDAGRCTRTGNSETPVIYQDRKGAYHRLKRHQVVPIVELPSPVESMRGMQLCAVSRVLRAAQYLRDIGVYQREKVAGNNPAAIHLVGGVASKRITDAMVEHKDRQTAQGIMRYIIPLVIGSIDPSASVSHEEIPLKSLPDDFDIDDVMRWYISQLALGFGVDYQDFAPLPGRGIGSSTEALVLHLKSRGKGPGFWMKLLEYTMNFHGIIPQNVTFSYDEQDVEADLEEAELERIEAESIDLYIKSGTLDAQAGRQLLLDNGTISEETFDRLSEEGDITSEVTAEDVEPVENKAVDQLRESMRKRRRRNRMRKLPRKRYAQVGGATDERPDFAEAQRLAIEEELAEAMDDVLGRALHRARASMGLEGVEAAKGRRFTARFLGSKQTPDDILGDEAFWRTFREDATVAFAPIAQRAALEAVDANIAIGVGVDLERVNPEVLAFTEQYTTEWWTSIQGSTQAKLRSAIMTWQETGLGSRGFPDLVKAIEPEFGRARARRIAVTETTRIFDEGNKLAHESGGINEEEWQTARDARVDDICRPLDGERFPINAGPRPVVNTHIGCVLPDTRVVAGDVVAAMRSFYTGRSVKITTERGHKLTVTPNHPIATPQGFRLADALCPGDYVISSQYTEGMHPIHEYMTHRPAKIEQVFRALTMSSTTAFGQRAGILDFHGDGRFMDGNIDIVGADGELRCTCQAQRLEPLHEVLFKGGGARQCSLPSLRLQNRDLVLAGAIAASGIGLGGKMLTIGSSSALHPSKHGYGAVPRLDPSLEESSSNCSTVDVQGSGNGNFRLASFITPDQIVDISFGEYNGHVYDLQTIGQVYISNGVAVHNCRCARLPVGPGGETLGR